MITIPADYLDSDGPITSFTITIRVVNGYGLEYSDSKTITVLDEPFFGKLSPEPNEQTGDDKRPVISAEIGNVGENPTFTMLVNGEEVEAEYKDGVLSYTPAEDMKDGRVTVTAKVVREDGKEAEKNWTFVVGKSGYQLYFGQLHSHTTYSDGSGTLETALEHIENLPEGSNVQFVAFTDHSNYFDTTSAANPADAMNDASLMTAASKELWDTYKGTVAEFNEKHSDILAIAGFEMTWSGGPGHINSFNTQGIVSRNNAELNNKSGDAGMKLYYATMNKDNGETLHQFNHPGATFGNFTDFSYWDEETDKRMFLVEVGNGEGQIGAGGYYPSYEQYIMALDKGWHLAPTNNQDNHKGRWGNANDARDVVLTNDFSEQGIYDAIRALRVYATEDKNLQIIYTVNGEQMGTIFGEENAPEKLDISVNLFDPDGTDSISKVEVVVDGGVTAYTWDDPEELEVGNLSVELVPEYSYYFIRVTQKDGDLAVTAPVWASRAVRLGIDDVKADKDPAIVNTEVTLTATLFNHEATAGTVKSVIFKTDGDKVIASNTDSHALAANGTVDVSAVFTPDKAKHMTIIAEAVIELDGKERTFTMEYEFSVRENEGELPVTSIDVVRKQEEAGIEYAIEGILTSNASGYDKDTAFFDAVYVQDSEGGICLFPVSGNYKIGDKVHVEGYTDFYQGEPELQIINDSIRIIGSGEAAPKEVSAAQINDLSVLGELVTLKGTVEKVEEANGLIQTIMVKDEAGDIARVFIDGYITTGNEVKNCVEGAKITVTGNSSYDNTWPDTDYFPRIRISNRANVICEAEIEDPIDAFVTRLYEMCLNREPEEEGFEMWTTMLREGTATAAQVVQGFFNSPEMEGMGLTDEEWVEKCYAVILDRESEAEGKAFWADLRGSGVSNNFILKGFVESKEFAELSAKYGITPGKIELTEWRDRNPGVTRFVNRCYTEALGRKAEAGGLNGWCRRILTAANKKAEAIYTATTGFFHSPEFVNKKTSDEQYVTILYRTFLGREPEPAGFNGWVTRLKTGMSRDEVMMGFANSKEFAAIMKSCGIE